MSLDQDNDGSGVQLGPGQVRKFSHCVNGVPQYEEGEEFDFGAVDEEAQEGGLTPEQLTRQFIVDVLDWVLSFVLYGGGGSKVKRLHTGFKRFVALAYVIKPAVLEGATLADLTSEMGLSRNALTRWTSELSYMFKLKGVNQKEFRSRLTYALKQMEVWQSEERQDLPKDFDEFVRHHEQLLKEKEEAEAKALDLEVQLNRLKRG